MGRFTTKGTKGRGFNAEAGRRRGAGAGAGADGGEDRRAGARKTPRPAPPPHGMAGRERDA